MLSSSAGQSNLRLIQESALFNISYSICYIYKISGSITYDDGGYAGTISYQNDRIVNVDKNTIISVPQLKDIL